MIETVVHNLLNVLHSFELTNFATALFSGSPLNGKDYARAAWFSVNLVIYTIPVVFVNIEAQRITDADVKFRNKLRCLMAKLKFTDDCDVGCISVANCVKQQVDHIFYTLRLLIASETSVLIVKSMYHHITIITNTNNGTYNH